MNFKDATKELVLQMANENAWVKLEQYAEMLEAQNKQMNLTGFKGDTLWKEGIYESLVTLRQVFNDPGNKRLLDIGAGAGFPSIPFKIIFPQVKLTIFEPQAKKANFLRNVSSELGLDVVVLQARAEEVKDMQFDLITARAVAPLNVLIEITHHLGKIGGAFAFIKGPAIFEEIIQSEAIIARLGVEFKTLKVDDEFLAKDIYVFTFFKNHSTPPAYPRPWAKIIAKSKN